MVRLAEMCLIRAEGNFRQNSSIGAPPLDDVNAVRGRANAPLLTAPLTIGDIPHERELELAFEGFLIHDLKRTGRNVGNLPATASRLILPIPQRERDVNPKLEQNEYYR